MFKSSFLATQLNILCAKCQLSCCLFLAKCIKVNGYTGKIQTVSHLIVYKKCVNYIKKPRGFTVSYLHQKKNSLFSWWQATICKSFPRFDRGPGFDNQADHLLLFFDSKETNNDIQKTYYLMSKSLKIIQYRLTKKHRIF